jgi:hypothetical protein
MAFTGTATVTRISDLMVRIAGLSLAPGAEGTISQRKGQGTIRFPVEVPDWNAYPGGSTPGDLVTLIEAVEVAINPVSNVSSYAIPIRVVKSGVDSSDFLITLTNDAPATASPTLDIYVKFHI